ncbi:UDP-glucose 4-epimerase GalE [Bradyrhizobium canariense]|uniref:UDP-glucose 4-epimerase GalE n=1 Tax=Bradyrhizobium canariense TaxID=255045 RepID=UPI000A191328|nr:UDP-glucose 4-epimerase GalE [Bradyrhizobium canariense]OSI30563.1 UDP-glucose 4-epimerase GalE [Bradyrhizobium canariense]OSI36703.1 UDP-glucose 4-epimerase GalE [Bradyrhizobium canariense]OSI49538.1 UDP-glucose 4-epimerase GalE [Bradyrhizobium canariense]OSI55390.1 UDP-glucose 4-epimerase GalE [Bradyrhizobium canariense]
MEEPRTSPLNPQPKLTCLVTGGAGYIGGHTVLALLDAGHQVIVLDDLSTGFRWSVPNTAKFIVGDVGDFDLVGRVIRTYKITSILHFAAKTVVPDSFQDPLGYYFTNAVKTRTLLAAAVSENVSDFIFSSTAAVYESSKSIVSVNQNVDPQSPYGRSKYMAECMIEDTGAAHNVRYAILRYFNVAGADPKGRNGQSTKNATHLIKVAIEAALEKRPCMEIFGNDYPTPDGFAVRDYIHVADLANAHVLALNRLQEGSESFTVNCGYGRGYSVREVVDVVKAVTGIEFKVRVAPRRTGDLASVVANSDQLRSFGWIPRYDELSTIVRHAYQWELKLAVEGH